MYSSLSSWLRCSAFMTPTSRMFLETLIEFLLKEHPACRGKGKAAALAASTFYPELVEDESDLEHSLLEGTVAPRRAAVPTGHTALEQQWCYSRPERPQPGHVLRRLPVHHLAVVQRGRHQHGWVVRLA